MRDLQLRALVGLVLIVVGALFLFQNLGVLPIAAEAFWGFLFAAAGAVFLYLYLRDSQQWWPLIPAFSLFGLGGLIATEALFPALGGVIGVPIFFTGISAGFWIIALTRREQWWALIPAGTMLSLALFIGLESAVPGTEWVGVFFIGLGLTFGLLALVPRVEERMSWAYVPAGVFLIMGILFMAAATSVLTFLGPAILILIGIYIVIRAAGARSGA